MISVVIPLFNKEATIERSLRSVLAQTFQDFEILVVNDGSTDGGSQLVAGNPRVRLVNQPNAGVAAARNRGIAEARGEIVAFLDADDEWLPEFLATVDGLAAARPEAGMFGTSYLYESRPAVLSDATMPDYFRVATESAPPINASAVAVRKAALAAVGGFPVGVKSGEDLLTWARLAARFPLAYDARPLAVIHDAAPVWRRPDDGDPVGCGLRELWPVGPRSLRRYTGLWHKMRAKMFLLLGERRNALREASRSLACAPWQPKLLVFVVLALLPTKMVRRVLE